MIVVGALIAAGGLLLAVPHPGATAPTCTDLLPGPDDHVARPRRRVRRPSPPPANAGVPPDKAGLAAALLNSSQQVGGALGLAIFSAIATARTNDLLAAHADAADALTAGFQRALLAGAHLPRRRRADRHPDCQQPR